MDEENNIPFFKYKLFKQKKLFRNIWKDAKYEFNKSATQLICICGPKKEINFFYIFFYFSLK